jgi:cytochrome c oxidase assembly protein subunit 19
MVAGTGGRKKAGPAKPPEKGAFPLDHGGECKKHATTFMACLNKHGSRHAPCKSLAKLYFECRMERGLMAKEDLGTMGFSEDQMNRLNETEMNVDRMQEARSKFKREGYVAGLRAKGFLDSEKQREKSERSKYFDNKSATPIHLREEKNR